MAIRGKFEIKGIEEYLSKIQKAGKNIDEAVKEAIKESAKPILADMMSGALPHVRTAKVYNALEIADIKQEGNYIYVEVGINEDKAKRSGDNAWVAVFQEYGSPTFEMDPFIRPAFDNNQSEVKKIQRSVLKRWGVPIK